MVVVIAVVVIRHHTDTSRAAELEIEKCWFVGLPLAPLYYVVVVVIVVVVIAVVVVLRHHTDTSIPAEAKKIEQCWSAASASCAFSYCTSKMKTDRGQQRPQN